MQLVEKLLMLDPETSSPSLLGDGDKLIEIVYGEEKTILCWAD
jgi:hypothetical protein